MTQVFLYICLSLSIQGIDIITQRQRKGQPVCGGWDPKNVTSVLPKTMPGKMEKFNMTLYLTQNNPPWWLSLATHHTVLELTDAGRTQGLRVVLPRDPQLCFPTR